MNLVLVRTTIRFFSLTYENHYVNEYNQVSVMFHINKYINI